MLRERLTSAAFGAGWVLVCQVPESWARAAFMLGADVAWRRQGHGVQVLEGNLRRVIGPDVDSGELRKLSRKVMRSYARYYLEDFRLHVIPRKRLLGSGLHLEGAERGNPKEKVAEMMQQLAAVFEQAIKEHPEDWHMLQRVFVADLDAERLKSTRNGAADANPDS